MSSFHFLSSRLSNTLTSIWPNCLATKHIIYISNRCLRQELLQQQPVELAKNDNSRDHRIYDYTTTRRQSLKSFLNACVFSNMAEKATSVLNLARNRNIKTPEDESPVDISAYNSVLRGWAQLGHLKRFKEIYNSITTSNISPDAESCAYYLLCLSKRANVNSEDVEMVTDEMKKLGVSLSNILNESNVGPMNVKFILAFIRKTFPGVVVQPPHFSSGYVCEIMDGFDKIEKNYYSPSNGLDLSNFDNLAKCQIANEVRGWVSMKSIYINEDEPETMKVYRESWKKYQAEWKKAIGMSFDRNIYLLRNKVQRYKGMNLLPYLVALKRDFYIDTLMKEVEELASESSAYSVPSNYRYISMGRKVMNRYFNELKANNGAFDEMRELYSHFLTYYKTASLTTAYNPREYWQKLMINKGYYPFDAETDFHWPRHIQLRVGRFLYDILQQEVRIDANIMRKTVKAKNKVPVFYSVYHVTQTKTVSELKINPIFISLYAATYPEEIKMDTTLMPMLSPPLPWISSKIGGYVISSTDFMREAVTDSNEQELQTLYPTVDALNNLSICPWKINKRVLDIAIDLFQKKGYSKLDIPLHNSVFSPVPKIEDGMTKSEKVDIFKKKFKLKREKAEMFSLWCSYLYRLSIANHLRDNIFWLPHNLDFRGRTYPCPPHFNHLGGDISRGIMLFAQGKPLGKDGLDWLKIHAINLTALLKKESVATRLKYANEIMDVIFDSADNPIDGKKWWMESDDPWQTLACCIEIANATRSEDPTKYICHFPVHQDGSCNGLQHYAALGRDEHGAVSVNLQPSNKPQDVYSDVAALVEKQRVSDAADGIEIAKKLEGFVGRKVVKRTVMTYVYGVTRYGANFQILKALKDMDTFPKEDMWPASVYIMMKTFAAIGQMFHVARRIQDWFTDVTQVITKDLGCTVSWVTPLGLHVVQPYYKEQAEYKSLHVDFHVFGDETEKKLKPSVTKQKNAFPPNFIHSLDSAHMMMTSLHCQRAGITFVSVHDCYWTHPSTVDVMNVTCRRQFVRLHTYPILKNLSDMFLDKYGPQLKVEKDNRPAKYEQIVETLTRIPSTGKFQLHLVLESIYFFS